jgi:hypothetical protein
MSEARKGAAMLLKALLIWLMLSIALTTVLCRLIVLTKAADRSRTRLPENFTPDGMQNPARHESVAQTCSHKKTRP